MSDEPLVLAIDCSTTGAKAVLFDRAGHAVGSGAAPLALSRPAPGRHEQDAGDWWTATGSAIRSLPSGARDRVVALCVTHQRESFVLLDGAGRPVRPAILWLDSRAGTEIAELGSARVHALSGKPPDVTPALYKLAWLHRHEPDLLHGAATVTEVHGYLVHRLTGGAGDQHRLRGLARAARPAGRHLVPPSCWPWPGCGPGSWPGWSRPACRSAG